MNKTDTLVNLMPSRHIRSYVIRAGRMTVAQAKALGSLAQNYMVPYSAHLLDLPSVFGRQAPLILEIGFGMGEATAQIAKARSADNFLCCEVHEPGVGALLKRVSEQNLGNIRVIQHDVVEVLEHMLATESLDGVHIFFPDPWHKKRHHKRRLIQPPFVNQLVNKIKLGGYIHCATDWQPYAVQMLEVMANQAQLANTSTNKDGFSEKPRYRPLTKFENRGLQLGHGVWDVVFQRVL